MCLQHIRRDYGIRYCEIIKEKIKIGLATGKSKDYINGLKQQGCPTGVRKGLCYCGRNNGGKSSKKGKGKNKKFVIHQI